MTNEIIKIIIVDLRYIYMLFICLTNVEPSTLISWAKWITHYLFNTENVKTLKLKFVTGAVYVVVISFCRWEIVD